MNAPGIYDVRKWPYYPIPMPVTADGKGPATVGVDAVRIEYEVWEAEPPHYSVASFDNLPDAINEAMRLNAALTLAPDGRAEGLREAAEILTVAAKAYEELRTSFSQKDISLETAERWLLAERDAILARAAELEKADE